MTPSTCPLTAYRSIRSWLAGDPPIIRTSCLPADSSSWLTPHVTLAKNTSSENTRVADSGRTSATGAALRDEAASGLVRHVAELGDRALDRVTDVRGDRQRAVDDARDRGAGHARQ